MDTLVNYGSLLKTVHNELATAEKMYQTALVAEPDHIDGQSSAHPDPLRHRLRRKLKHNNSERRMLLRVVLR